MSSREDRRYGAVGPSPSTIGDARQSFRKDHDRLYYTPSFRRLTGITQVAAPYSETALIHNRYIHSDKVAQLGRSIAEYLLNQHGVELADSLGGLSPDVVGAAGLAHDIGHPPYGHAGEKVLHALAMEWEIDGFEGNAQTFRILTKLAVKSEGYPGLDLTRATRNAVLKYPWYFADGPGAALVERHSKKWSVYRSEGKDFEEARLLHPLPDVDGEKSQSIEASVMEVADDISYALHDFEDFYRTGLISMSTAFETRSPVYKKQTFEASRKALRKNFDHSRAEAAWMSILTFLELPIVESLRRPFDGSAEQEAALTRLVSYHISKFIAGIQLTPDGLNIESSVDHEISIWKHLTWHFVISRPEFAAIQRGQSGAVRRATELTREWAEDEGMDSPRLPQRLRDYFHAGLHDEDHPDHPNIDESSVLARAVLDYIASLTEPQLLNLSEKLVGPWRGSMLSNGDM